ncbi:unnamed protein product [Ilex paraguariensis]|uniref:Cation/H+ exchanger domain-containing protein n=1 Tax=Ilex paraguariensis TaxID=185542 RepID=A0ABC8STS6_9AQUA
MLETTASFGLMFFLFTVGVKMDPAMMVRPGRTAILLGVSAMFITMALTVPLSFVFKNYVPMDASLVKSFPLIAASQCLTPFPDIAYLLTELKIVNTDLGRLALSSAMFCDMLGISLTAVGFAALPVILQILKRKLEGEPVGESLISTIFVIVLITGFLSETIGQHYVLGSLVLGLVVPEGSPLGAELVSKLDYPISKVLYPTFLTVSGLKTNIFKIDLQSLWIVAFFALFSSLVKIGAMILPARYNNIPVRDAVVLGLMMNARGIVELVLYNLWLDAQILTDQEFALVVLSVIGTTAIRVTALRILVCIQNQDNVPSIVNLLEASNATKESPIAVIAVLLVKLVGRTTPILIAHQPQRTLESSTSRSSHIINALRHYELYNETCVTVQSFSAILHFETMHEDVCRVALDQNANIVIMPFHKNWTIDGSIGSINRAMQGLNLKVLDKAPCSVGILVDRGILCGSLSILNNQSVYNVAVIYIGGADDAESLCYGSRMVRHRHVTLTVIRFLLFGCHNARERKLDNDFISAIRQANTGNDRFVYQEEVVRDGVGLAASLDAWSECRELGIIGDMLASPDFGITASVLVVQQQKVGGKIINPTMKPVIHNQNTPRHGTSATLGSSNNRTWAISMDRTL